MKKITLFFAFCFATINGFAQTIVSTTPENKKVILEEFTGVNCQFCPDGHARANALKEANPNDFFVINIHVGGYATPSGSQPDFRTPFGTAIAGQTGLTGYPSGTINRKVFSSAMTPGGTAMGRFDWAAATNQVLAESSYVNVGTTATIDAATRELTVNVEAYYTGSSPVSTNKLNVALLQNNTAGPQTGGGAGVNYQHQHRLIHLLTGQWGEDITTTTSGSLVTQTYTYTIPATYNLIPAVIGDFEIVAFVSEGNQNIISGNGCEPTYTNLPTNEVKLSKVEPILAQCTSSTSIAPKITIQNRSQDILTSATVNYSLNSGTPQTYSWTGSLGQFEKQTITLNPIEYSILTTNTLNVTLADDDDMTNNNGTTTFGKAVNTDKTNITIKITLDQWGSETSWMLKNSAGDIVQQNPPYFDSPAAGTYPQADINLTLPNDCYNFIVKDSYGDGMSPGSFKIFADGVQIPGISGGSFTSEITKTFGIVTSLANNSFNKSKISLFPNPTSGILKITTENSVNIEIIDVFGKIVLTSKGVVNNDNIDLSSLTKGLYLAKITGESINYTEKIILN